MAWPEFTVLRGLQSRLKDAEEYLSIGRAALAEAEGRLAEVGAEATDADRWTPGYRRSMVTADERIAAAIHILIAEELAHEHTRDAGMAGGGDTGAGGDPAGVPVDGD